MPALTGVLTNLCTLRLSFVIENKYLSMAYFKYEYLKCEVYNY